MKLLACIVGLCVLVLGCSNAQLDFNVTLSNAILFTSDVCDGCVPGLCFPVSGCAGCDVVAGWCSDGTRCTRNCKGEPFRMIRQFKSFNLVLLILYLRPQDNATTTRRQLISHFSACNQCMRTHENTFDQVLICISKIVEYVYQPMCKVMYSRV